MAVQNAQTSANNDHLSAYRDAPVEERVPQSVSDDPNPPPAADPASAIPATNELADPAGDPPMRSDPRMEIARRAKQRREQSAAGNTLIDPMSVPDGVRLEGEEQEPKIEDLPPLDASPPPTQEQHPDRYTLRVNKNDFSVSRDELLRYAELSPEEADGLPDLSLVRIAQKNLAAQDFLEQAKQASKTARLAAREEPGHQPEYQQRVAEAQQANPQVTPDLLTDDELEAIQLGDKEEAKRAFATAAARIAQQTIAAQTVQQRAQAIMGEAQQQIERFAKENPDIVGDEDLAMDHRTYLVREAVSDLAKIPGFPQQAITQALNNPQYAMDLYQAARIDGHNLRPPAQIFEAATTRLRNRNGPTVSERISEGLAAYDARRDAKRGLIQQPVRSESPLNQSPQPQQPQRRSISEIIQKQYVPRVNGFKAPPG